MIEPISDIQQRHVEAVTASYIKVASGLYDQKFELVPVHFDLKGKCAGMYEVKGRSRRIRYNPWLFAKYWEDSLKNTVTHEVAHYLVDCIYGLRRVKTPWRGVERDNDRLRRPALKLPVTTIWRVSRPAITSALPTAVAAEPTISPVCDTSALSSVATSIAASTVITSSNRCRQPGDEPVVCLHDPGH